MAAATSADLIAQLRQYRLLEPAHLEEVERALVSEFPKPKGLARELMRRGWLSPYQVNQLFTDRGQTLLLGSYILVERLGGGGMGDVFKARNWKFGTTVALKVIRDERIADPRAVQRFHREIRAAAQLTHPNIVRAYDADEVNGRHLLVMEYVEGVDLAKLVKVQGPLPVAQACDFIRQAALGLQHAFERGMVHRDIKPHNLLLADAQNKEPTANHDGPQTGEHGRIKILDMGLARVAQASDDSDSSGTMTHDGVIVGTPDYIAPEQARESHKVDIRADLYSLGCTFFYLLTGKVPFPSGSLIQKLYKHQFDDAPTVESVRPEVPHYIGDIVRKLMAKLPDDRFQTPAELVEVLAADHLASLASASVLSTARAEASKASATAKASARTAANGKRDATAALWSSVVTPAGTALPKRAEKATSAFAMPTKLWVLIGGGVLALIVAVVSSWLLFGRGPGRVHDGNPSQGQSPPPIVKAPTHVDAGWIKQVAALSGEEQVNEVARMMQVLNPSFDGALKPTLERNAVIGLELLTDHVTDLNPLKALPKLKHLVCQGRPPNKGRLADLSPLKGLPLESLDCRHTQVADLTPLKGMPLRALNCAGTTIYDLTPLQGMPLQKLHISSTAVTDLAPLQRMRLTELDCRNTDVLDLAPLKTMPLHRLVLDYKPWRDGPILHSIKTLTTINDLPEKTFSERVASEQAEFEAWAAAVAKSPPLQQVAEVAKELSRRNPGFHEVLTPRIENYAVVVVSFPTDNVRDLSPVRAFPKLQRLECKGSGAGKGRLTDLSPLAGLKITSLDCSFTKVADLAPLKDLPLIQLVCDSTPVADLSPLQGMALTSLSIVSTQVTDLTPIAGLRLTFLRTGLTRIKDLSPLKGMPLQQLGCEGTLVKDLAPVASLPLTRLLCANTQIADLTPLKGLALVYLAADQTRIADLAPLRGMPLETLFLLNTPATDLSPLAGMPLNELNWSINPQRDLKLLNSLTALTKINGMPAAQVLKQAGARLPKN